MIDEHNIESDVMARLARLTELDGAGLWEPETRAAQTYADAGAEARRLRDYEDARGPGLPSASPSAALTGTS